ncbi:hypothetical protein BVC80_7485g2 [Macleaya cordata]|uniref:Uncharacterized protein n=1 Tax=Macleaya cordata TaxID=56857 RepID=A0A200Q530_MACCD|nr:hypothetical protein BVC80_7485g2 [Macleaya cordata]
MKIGIKDEELDGGRLDGDYLAADPPMPSVMAVVPIFGRRSTFCRQPPTLASGCCAALTMGAAGPPDRFDMAA